MIQRLQAGGWPGSNTHRWGTRYYELRTIRSGASGAAIELRLHDEISFQGSGMTPAQMPPLQHDCTRWEPLPATIQVPAGATSCDDVKAECAAIEAFLRSTRRPAPPFDPNRVDLMVEDTTFGRGGGSCR